MSSIPENLKFTPDHEWVLYNEKDGTALVGITDFAQSELGDIVYVECDAVDQDVPKNEVFGTVEAVKTSSDLFMPLSGKVIEFNPALDENDGDNPALINESPYEEGWIIKIQVNDPAELEDLLDASAYEAIIL